MKSDSDSSIDDLDSAILDVVSRQGRATYGEIGRAVGLSAPATKRRLDRLEATGVIVGYRAVIDSAKVGRPLEAFAELRFSGNARVDDISTIAADIPEVEAVFTVAGDPDALVWIRVADVHDLKRVVDRLRSTGRVVGTKTMMVLGTSRRGDKPSTV